MYEHTYWCLFLQTKMFSFGLGKNAGLLRYSIYRTTVFTLKQSLSFPCTLLSLMTFETCLRSVCLAYLHYFDTNPRRFILDVLNQSVVWKIIDESLDTSTCFNPVSNAFQLTDNYHGICSFSFFNNCFRYLMQFVIYLQELAVFECFNPVESLLKTQLSS